MTVRRLRLRLARAVHGAADHLDPRAVGILDHLIMDVSHSRGALARIASELVEGVFSSSVVRARVFAIASGAADEHDRFYDLSPSFAVVGSLRRLADRLDDERDRSIVSEFDRLWTCQHALREIVRLGECPVCDGQPDLWLPTVRAILLEAGILVDCSGSLRDCPSPAP